MSKYNKPQNGRQLPAPERKRTKGAGGLVVVQKLLGAGGGGQGQAERAWCCGVRERHRGRLCTAAAPACPYAAKRQCSAGLSRGTLAARTAAQHMHAALRALGSERWPKAAPQLQPPGAKPGLQLPPRLRLLIGVPLRQLRCQLQQPLPLALWAAAAVVIHLPARVANDGSVTARQNAAQCT